MLIKLLPTHIIIYLFLLLVCYTLCCGAQLTSGQATINKAAPLFNTESVKVLTSKSNSQTEDISIKKIKTFSLVAAKELMLTLVGVEQNDESNSQVNLLAKYIETTESTWGNSAIVDIDKEGKWNVQLVTENRTSFDKNFAKITLVTHEKNNKIYIFAVNGTKTEKDSQNYISYENADITLFVGTIVDTTIELKSKIISWDNERVFKLSKVVKKQEDFKNEISKLLITDISVFVTTDDKIVLLLKINIEDKNTKIMTFLINFETSTNSVEFSYVDTVDSCNPHLFLWNDKIIMMPTDCKTDAAGGVTLREFTEINGWVNSTGLFYRLLDLLKNKKDFTQAKISSSILLLFTKLKKNGAVEVTETENCYLFIFDGTRVKKVGLIGADVSKTEPVRLLFTGGELFTLHKKSTKEEDYKNVMLTRQQELLATIQLVSNSWSNADNNIKKQCANFFGKNVLCDTNLFTDGLVGFLSNNKSKNNKTVWHDEYYYLDATVQEGELADDGFLFNKPGARALWPVGRKENLPYNFAAFGFTLVATVEFDNPQEVDQKRSVLGVTLDDSTQSVGVWCLNNKVFALSEDGQELAEEIPKSECLAGKKYHIALVYNNSKVSVFVNWEPLGNKKDIEMGKSPEESLKFYFGAASDNEDQSSVVSHVKITNVLLYNRPFTSDEIINLKKNSNNNNLPLSPQTDESDVYKNPKSDNNDSENFQKETETSTDTSPPQTTFKGNEEVVTSSTQQRENAVGNSVNIIVNVVICSVLSLVLVLFILRV